MRIRGIGMVHVLGISKNNAFTGGDAYNKSSLQQLICRVLCFCSICTCVGVAILIWKLEPLIIGQKNKWYKRYDPTFTRKFPRPLGLDNVSAPYE